MAPDPRGSPTDEEYIQHLEFMNEQRQKEIEELMREKHHRTRLWKRVLFKLFVRLMRASE